MEKVLEVYGEYREKYQWFEEQLGQARSKQEIDELVELRHPARDYAPKLLDLHLRVIRYRDVRGKELEDAVAKLLSETEGAKQPGFWERLFGK